MSTLVSWENLQIAYNSQLVTMPFSGQIQRGEKWAVLGPNGSGKSSWMKSLLGLQPLNSGSRMDWHTDLSKVSYVPQSLDFDSRFPIEMTEFLEISLSHRLFQSPWPWISQKSAIQKVVQQFELQNLLSKKLDELSRGQVQKAILARAYMSSPEFIFFDEPLTGLDPKSRSMTLKFIFQSVETLVMILHESDWKSLGFTHCLHFQEDLSAQPVVQSLS